MTKIDPCATMRNNLIAAALGLQQCTKTAANIVPLPGTERFIAIGTPADVERLLATQSAKQGAQPSAWISVDERLPEYDCRVLASTWFTMAHGKRLEIVAFRRGTGKFSHSDVTHWMPLPAAPGAAPAAQVQADVRDQALEEAAQALDALPRSDASHRPLLEAAASIRAMKSKRAASTDGDQKGGA